MTMIMGGEAMPNPKSLTEALAQDAAMEAEIGKLTVQNKGLDRRYNQNWNNIYSGFHEIRSPGEAAALLDKMVCELEHSHGDFVDGIVGQVKAYITALAGAPALEAAE